MVTAGAQCPAVRRCRKSRAATLRCLRRHVPAAVPGIVFLSGGQEERLATLHLDAINRLPEAKPWTISFSYGRALQDPALKAWHGRDENLTAGAQAIARARPLQQRRQPRNLYGKRWRPPPPSADAVVAPSDAERRKRHRVRNRRTEGCVRCLRYCRLREADHAECAVGCRAVADRRVLARRQLSLGRPDLSLRQPAAEGAAVRRSTSSRGCSATGARRRASTSSTST